MFSYLLNPLGKVCECLGLGNTDIATLVFIYKQRLHTIMFFAILMILMET